jgi:hypothetical protein
MVFFNEVWDKIDILFNRLHQFYGGLAMTFLNTTLIELDFSVLKWEKDNNHSSMINPMLEGIFQCKQMIQISILQAPNAAHPYSTTINETVFP